VPTLPSGFPGSVGAGPARPPPSLRGSEASPGPPNDQPGIPGPARGSVRAVVPLGSRSGFAHPQCRHPTGAGRAIGDHIATDDARINDRIRAREVRLIGADGEQLGVQPLPVALGLARENELDLVEVAANADPPVCKIMDFNRWKYEQEQKRKESRRKTTQVVIKEMKFRPKIDGHDYETKMRHVERFLGEGNKVKLTIMFRGREVAHPELGLKILNRIADQVADFAIVESAPRQDGRNMTMVLHPVKKDSRKPKPAPVATAAPAAAEAAPAPDPGAS